MTEIVGKFDFMNNNRRFRHKLQGGTMNELASSLSIFINLYEIKNFPISKIVISSEVYDLLKDHISFDRGMFHNIEMISNNELQGSYVDLISSDG